MKRIIILVCVLVFGGCISSEIQNKEINMAVFKMLPVESIVPADASNGSVVIKWEDKKKMVQDMKYSAE